MKRVRRPIVADLAAVVAAEDLVAAVAAAAVAASAADVAAVVAAVAIAAAAAAVADAIADRAGKNHLKLKRDAGTSPAFSYFKCRSKKSAIMWCASIDSGILNSFQKACGRASQTTSSAETPA